MPFRKQTNSIVDVAGICVGNAHEEQLKSGATVVICDTPATAAVQVLGGAPGTRETDLLAPHNMVQTVDALCLSGGSAYGLDAASGAQAALREMGRGFAVGPHRVPIVPSAILFDLINGGDKHWGRYSPYRELGYKATMNADRKFEQGSAGAGYGALVADLKGGLGSASTIFNGITIGALVAVNSVGGVTIGSSPHFWAAAFENDNEFGGLGLPHPLPQNADQTKIKFREHMKEFGSNTTIGVIATDAKLSKAEAKRLAIAAHDGFSRAIWPAHTPADGDLVFALATGHKESDVDSEMFTDLCAAAAATMARAIARGIYLARPAPNDLFPCWCEKFCDFQENR